MTINRQLRIFYPFILGLFFIISAVILHFVVKGYLINQKIDELNKETSFLSYNILPSPNNNYANKDLVFKNYEKSTGYQALIIDYEGGILYYSNNFPSLPKPLTTAKLNKWGRDFIYEAEIKKAKNDKIAYSIRYNAINHNKYFLFVKRVDKYYLCVASPYAGVNSILGEFDIFIIIFCCSALVLLFYINLHFASLVLKPINEIIIHSKNYIKDLNYRIPYIEKPEEINKLQTALNKVAKLVQKNVMDLSNRKDLVETVIKNISEGVLILDRSLRVVLCNSGIYNLLDVNLKVYRYNVEKKFYYELIRNNAINDMIERAYNKAIKIKENIKLSSMNDKVIEVNCISLPSKSGMVVLINDVTEQYKLIKIKRSFVENISHEFKTPLSIIRGYIETLLKFKDSNFDDREKFLLKILHNTARLTSLVNDLITINKLDEGKDYFRKEKVNLYEVVESSLDALSVKAERKNIRLINTITEEKMEVIGNVELLEAVFFNLIDNGIVYTENGGIVEVSLKHNKEVYKIYVTDSGIGVPRKHIDRIFERFYRVDEGRSRILGGTGLGLSIVKNALVYHDGSVKCEASPKGKGTQFIVSLPIPD